MKAKNEKKISTKNPPFGRIFVIHKPLHTNFYLETINLRLAPIPELTSLTPEIAIARLFLAPLNKNSTPPETLLINNSFCLFILKPFIVPFLYNGIRTINKKTLVFELRLLTILNKTNPNSLQTVS